MKAQCSYCLTDWVLECAEHPVNLDSGRGGYPSHAANRHRFPPKPTPLAAALARNDGRNPYVQPPTGESPQ